MTCTGPLMWCVGQREILTWRQLVRFCMRLMLDENGLTALTLLIAESDPNGHDFE